MMSAQNLKYRSIESNHWFEIYPESGLPKLFGLNQSLENFIKNINSEIYIEVDGTEQRSSTGGLEYLGTGEYSNLETLDLPEKISSSNGTLWKIPVKFGEILGSICYCFNDDGPAISVKLIFNKSNHLIRNVKSKFIFELSGEQWKINLPGNGLRSNLDFTDLKESTGVSPLGGLRGSASLIHLGCNSGNIVLWPDNVVEIPEILFSTESSNKFTLEIKSNFGSDLNDVNEIDLPLFSLDLNAPSWVTFPSVFQNWLLNRSIASPANPPEWIERTLIFEAQIGFSVFGKVNKYSPYPEVQDLINDLDRIASLGFTCIQLMPKQPYPSYNIHDYADIDTSYGNREKVKELVDLAHKKGIKVILDVLLHGVLDKEIIKLAADGVRSGPFKELIESETNDSFSTDVKDWHNYLIAWSRHILDFEPFWYEGSPSKTTLEIEHPDWFYRNSQGEITGVYTKAFDARNIEWQKYFIDSMVFLVKELNIDGFRFDAPTYNDFYNWAPWARYRAGASALACTSLFEKMRPIFKEINSDFLFYTEPSGLCLRKSMDLNYNYDEQWLVTALGDPKSKKEWGIRSAKDVAIWISERDALLPNGSMTAHHIDSHDTFWWPSWGKKWRREQFDLDTVKLLTLIFGSLPGPFMMFVGGEEGIEDLLPKMANLKANMIWLNGAKHWWVGSDTPEEIFGFSRIFEKQGMTVLVNMSDSFKTIIPEISMVDIEVVFSLGALSKVSETLEIAPRSAIVLSHKV